MFLTKVNITDNGTSTTEHMFSFRLDTTSDDLKLVLYTYQKVEENSVETYSESAPRCLNSMSLEDIVQTHAYTQAVEDAKQNIETALGFSSNRFTL